MRWGVVELPSPTLRQSKAPWWVDELLTWRPTPRGPQGKRLYKSARDHAILGIVSLIIRRITSTRTGLRRLRGDRRAQLVDVVVDDHTGAFDQPVRIHTQHRARHQHDLAAVPRTPVRDSDRQVESNLHQGGVSPGLGSTAGG